MGRSILITCLVFTAAVLGAVVATGFRDATRIDRQLSERGAVVFAPPRTIAPFRLVAGDGSPFTPEALQGHWTLVFFGYTHCPDVCPTTLAELRHARDAWRAQSDLEAEVVMVSVDPEGDTPQLLERYVGYFSPDFIGVTGTPEAVSEFAADLHVGYSKIASEGPESYFVEHSGYVVVLNPLGRYQAIFKPPHRGDNIAAMLALIAHGF